MDASATLAVGGPLKRFSEALHPQGHWTWAYDNFDAVVSRLISEFSLVDVCELGGGRSPKFSEATIASQGLRYVVNDISSAELARAPAWVEKAQFDLASPALPEAYHRRFDLVFSHMLMEHVRDCAVAYRNIYAMLRPGGIFFNFHPVLYSPALVFNWVMPETLTKRILLFLQPNRHDEGYPKFPARYSYCVVSPKTERMLQDIGFTETILVPFYGNDYLKKLPPLQAIEDWMSGYAMREDKRLLASLCYSLGRK